MELDTEVEMKGGKSMRPPRSYGSMKSDSDEEEEERKEEDNKNASPPVFPVVLPESTPPEQTGIQMIRSNSPETLDTMTTLQTKPPGAFINTRSTDLEEFTEEDEEDMDDMVTNSPEPPENIELDDTAQNDENGQPGRLHLEQDLSHIFKSIQSVLTDLTMDELFSFKMWLFQSQKEKSLQQVMEGDILDFVDKMLEVFGPDYALSYTINTLEIIKKETKAEELRNLCKRALIRFHLKQHLITKHKVIREGVPRPGKQNFLNAIYVEPQISTCGYGGVYSSHVHQDHHPSPLQVPNTNTFVGLNNLFRLQKENGQPVRTVLTTGIPGIGMSVSVAKFCLDWAELRANKDLQFVITLSFHSLWFLRNRNGSSQKMSIMEVIQYYHPECKGIDYLEKEDCRFLIIIDSFDCYQAPLDWENAPQINDIVTPAHLDVLIVNIIRGTALRAACLWILGRRAAVSQIPSEFIDIVTEIQGFSDEMKDHYLTKRFCDPELAAKIVAHYKRLPTLSILARQPFVCWMAATMFERYYHCEGYGVHPPRLTPFYVNIAIVQTNRRLEFYEKPEHNLKWSNEIRLLLTKMGNMAFRMLERNTNVFFEEEVTECGLNLKEVTVFSGLCTELPSAPSGRRTFCFIHFTFQEFMAALYVFTTFRSQSKNVLDSGASRKTFSSTSQSKSLAGLVQSAVVLTLSAPQGRYDMFLRFLCGLLSPDCHDNQLSGFLYDRKTPKLSGLDEVQQMLKQTIETAHQTRRERVENLKECLREMTQVDE